MSIRRGNKVKLVNPEGSALGYDVLQVSAAGRFYQLAMTGDRGLRFWVQAARIKLCEPKPNPIKWKVGDRALYYGSTQAMHGNEVRIVGHTSRGTVAVTGLNEGKKWTISMSVLRPITSKVTTESSYTKAHIPKRSPEIPSLTNHTSKELLLSSDERVKPRPELPIFPAKALNIQNNFQSKLTYGV